jgi:prolyl-tRNA synthetase
MADRLSGDKRELAVDYATLELDGESITASLEELQRALTSRARQETMSRLFEVRNYDEFKDCIASGKGFAIAAYDGTAATEARMKEETGATTRILLPQMPEPNVKCILSDGPATRLAYFAASY